MKKIMICAGEVSGDMHASAVIQAMKQVDPNVSFYGVAGQSMQKQGCHVLHDIKELSVMGITDVIYALPRLRRIMKFLLIWVDQEKPDLVILVDYPGFNVRLGTALRKKGVKVLYYIAPKLWAWGSWRVKKLMGAQDTLASILPFESAWFANHHIEATYVGNPSVQSCRQGWTRQDLCEKYQLNKDERLVALLPGSRAGELKRHIPLLAETLMSLQKKHPRIQCVVPQAPSSDVLLFAPLLDLGVTLIPRQQENFALPVDAAIAVSGTATLELALWSVPTVLVYKSSALSMAIGRRLVQLKCVGLANIILGDRPVMPELWQEAATVENILYDFLPLLEDSDERRLMLQSLQALKSMLGESNPAEAVARLAQEMWVDN
ncbi:MAG: lipid-A-disaccharide synthase [Mariprofundaceae bacterium]|nr:lipid-A-disaccharide synthase [Mariprofundaceae bacterium]